MNNTDEFEFLYDRDRYESYYGKEEELSYSERMLIAEENGWLELVKNFEQQKLEKARAELEERKKELGLE